MDVTTSVDGTRLAYERSGEGPALVLVLGALNDRHSGAPLAAALTPRFTVLTYDRRGRGDSGDTPPYAPEREIEDLDALIRAVGGSAFVYGHSSGAALALEAALAGLPITKLALYEPPYIVDASRPPQADDYLSRLQALVAAARRADTVELFWREGLGLPTEAVTGMRAAPWFPSLEALARTIPYDIAILGDHMRGRPLPAEWATRVTIPTLVIDGAESSAQLRNAVAALAELLPQAERRTLEGQGHGAPPEVLVPVLEPFFLG